MEAVYVANLHPMNARAQQALDPDPEDGALGVARGKATFTIRGDLLTATVHAEGLEPNMIHPQHIHEADRCPPGSADVNRDGFVDVIEGVPFYGPIMVPLDNNLADTSSNAFPMAFGRKGVLEYRASDSKSAIEAMLGHPLALETRHVVLHGVDLNTWLPPTVKSLPGLPAQLTLPVACGEIRRMNGNGNGSGNGNGHGNGHGN